MFLNGVKLSDTLGNPEALRGRGGQQRGGDSTAGEPAHPRLQHFGRKTHPLGQQERSLFGPS